MPHREDFEVLKRRTGFLEYGFVAVFVVLGIGYWYHQMVRSSHFGELADRNRVRYIPQVAPRGRVYDRERRLLADNRPSYNVVLLRENSTHTFEETARALAGGLGVPEPELVVTMEKHRREPRFRPIVLKEDASVADMAFVRAHRYELPEVSVEFQPRRRYIGGDALGHALGYVGEITESQLANPDFLDYRPGDLIGQTGLERQYNAVLRGRDGFRRVIVNSVGKEMGKLEEEPAVPGNDLFTTLDLDLQRAADEAIGDRVGSAVAIDPNTGEVLALVSKPSFDPNVFATRISSADWNALISDSRKPLQNRAIQSHYSPGSVFKVFMAAAALEAATVNSLETTFCPGHATFFGHTFGCNARSGHGTVNLHRALVHSCNVFFYNVGNQLGIDRIAAGVTRMGLGLRTGIDLPNEDPGLIPSPEWKKRVQKSAWYAGETISVSIGQGAVSVTPLQAAYAMGGLAAGGRLRQPHLVTPEKLKTVDATAVTIRKSDYSIHQTTVDAIGRALWGVVNEGGTGGRARVEGFDVAGKTGTAQVVGKASGKQGGEFEDHAWFVGFAPYRNPEIVIAVIVENGGHGGAAAAPVAQAVLDVYYRKKLGRFNAGDAQPMASLVR